jgi:two-component sensor histidine kinase
VLVIHLAAGPAVAAALPPLWFGAALATTLLGGGIAGGAAVIAGAVALTLSPLPGVPPVALAFWLIVAGSPVGAVGLLRRDRMRVEDEHARLAARLETQRALLREVQHRVAGGLQLVASVISLSAARAGSICEARAALDEAIRRIGAIARVHRRLADPALLDQPPGRVIGALLRDLLAAAGREDIAATVDIPAERLGPHHLAVVAMLTAEATLHALGNGFAGRHGGVLTIALGRAGGRQVLRVTDDGPGPPDDEVNGQAELGLRVIESLARQVGGTAIVARVPTGRDGQGGGSVVELSFPA